MPTTPIPKPNDPEFPPDMPPDVPPDLPEPPIEEPEPTSVRCPAKRSRRE